MRVEDFVVERAPAPERVQNVVEDLEHVVDLVALDQAAARGAGADIGIHPGIRIENLFEGPLELGPVSALHVPVKGKVPCGVQSAPEG